MLLHILARLFLIISLGVGLTPTFPASPAGAEENNLARNPATGPSGLPLPRFVSLASAKANMRVGPGTRYPVAWVYTRKGLPLEITHEYDLWRKVRDPDGVEGWMHRQLLRGRRSVVITADQVPIRKHEEPDAPPVAIAKRGVVGTLLGCTKAACRLEIDGRRGWADKSSFWGAYPSEVFD